MLMLSRPSDLRTRLGERVAARTPSKRVLEASLEGLSVFVVSIIGAAVFFRDQWTTSFRAVMGNDGDTRLLVYLLEHWFQVFGGHAAWRDPAFFYPVKNVLGSSDGLLFYQVFYTPARAVGVDPFLAAQLSVILLSLVGYASFVCLVRLVFAAPRIIALLGGLIFTFSNALWLHSGWFQLLAVWLVPAVLLLGVGSLRASHHRLTSTALACGFGVLLAVCFYTGYYVTWFSVLAAGLALTLFVVAGRGPISGFREHSRLVVAAALAFAAGIVPFMFTYLPARDRNSHYTYPEVLSFAAQPHDILNVSQQPDVEPAHTRTGSICRFLEFREDICRHSSCHEPGVYRFRGGPSDTFRFVN